MRCFSVIGVNVLAWVCGLILEVSATMPFLIKEALTDVSITLAIIYTGINIYITLEKRKNEKKQKQNESNNSNTNSANPS